MDRAAAETLYTSDIRHIAGKENVADALSKPAAMVMPAPGGQVDLLQLPRAAGGVPKDTEAVGQEFSASSAGGGGWPASLV